MASNLLGALGGFLDAFTRSKEHKKDREEADRYKKVMTELLELQIDSATRKQEAQTRVGQMMSPQQIHAAPVPQFEFPPEGELGEIGLAGRVRGPSFVKPGMSFMDLMADPDGRIAALESGMAEQLQQADQLTAQSEFVRAMETSGMEPLEFLNTQEGGALAVRAGMNPSEFLRASQDASGGLDALRADMLELQIGNERRTQQQAGADKDKARRELEVGTRGAVRDARELAALNDELEGTALETGQPFGEVYRAVLAGGAPALEALGFDTTEARETVAKFDRFSKLATDYSLSLLEKYKEFGTITQGKLEQIQKSMASTATSPGANRLAVADALQTVLDSADIEGIEIPEREEVEALLESMRSRGVRPANEALIDVPAAGRAVGDAARRVIKFSELPD